MKEKKIEKDIHSGGHCRHIFPGPAVWLLVLLCALTLPAASLRAADPTFPLLSGRVVDMANLLSEADEAQIRTDLEALETKSTDQLVVVTLPSLQGFPIEDYGYRLGRHWAIGQKDKNNGVLLIVAPKERKVRIEVGRGLEPSLTDALTKVIIENAILPRFKAGDFPGGIKVGVSDIIAVLTGNGQELKAQAKSDRNSSTEPDIFALLIVIIWLIISVLVFWSIIQSIRHGSTSSGSKGGSGGWGSSGGGGWSSGGGGFSGGGGGFGGGGSSGSW